MPRPRKPTKLKILAGDREDRINRNEPIPDDEAAITPPMPLSEGARAVWNRLAPDLIDKHVLTSWDVDLFTVFCESVSTFYECQKLMGTDYLVPGSVNNLVASPYWRIMRDCVETMSRVGGRFGLTPADRAGVDVSGEGPTLSGERFFT